MNLLEVRDLNAYRGTAHVLQGMSFDVPVNKVTALLGRNGVGKTTTLLSIIGALRTTGSITLEGTQLLDLPIEKRIRRGIGYVPEEREIFTRLTVAENLRLAERPGATPRYDLVYELFPILAERRDQTAGTVSGGQQQMLALGRVLLNENQLLLIDEPTNGLSPAVIGDVVRSLEQAKSETTVVLVEQNLAVAARLADVVVVVDHGTVVHRGPMAELVEDPALGRSLLGVDVAVPARLAPGPAQEPRA